ncbi:MAG TPA: Gfo/Idh/MocA family oxidoreductase [Acidobacteriaceae bacterium]|jgi:predicted dehydrogenase|nr:Gfo/Idh/MocA family oxidoreductase [Acidobacteriaceae bacterium]
MQPIRFAILGFGYHAAFRLVPSFRNCAHATLVGFHRRDPAKAARDAAAHNLRAFASAEALCASPEVDAIFITSPDALHLADAQLAFAHNKPVLCEKPLTSNAADADTMLAAANVSGKLFGVAHHYRWAHAVQQIRARVAAGEIGEPRTAHAEFNYAAHLSRRPWITDPALAAGGPIGDVGVHCIDTLRFILGAFSGENATRARSVSTIATQDADSGPVEASASMQFEFANNVLASVNVSARAHYRTQIEIVGADGVLVAENGMTVDHPVDVTLRRKGVHVNTNTVDNADAYTRMIDNFAQTLRGEEQFLGPGAEGVRNQHILDAAFKSWRSAHREAIA